MNVNRTTLAGWALLIFAGTIWLYWSSIHGGFLANMDDDLLLQDAERWHGQPWPAVKWALTNTQPYYRPLARLSQAADYGVWGTNAVGHHATNVVLHALNAALVFGFVWALLGMVASLTPGERLLVALGVAVVFAIHPLQVESVAWISGRTQLLCTTFGIGCLWAYVNGAPRWLVWGLFVMALLCKPMAISLPFAILAIDYFPLRRHEQLGWGGVIRENAALIALGAAAGVATLITESHDGTMLVRLEVVRPLQRIYLAVQSLTFYPWKLVWPAWLSATYPLRLGFSLRPALILMSALGVSLITILSLWRRRQTPALLAGWLAYLMLILPVSGLAQIGGQAVADRYAYIAMLPLLLLAGGAAVWLWRRCAPSARLILICLLAGECCFFGMRTHAQILVWRNDETLWRDVLVHYPNSHRAHNNLGASLCRPDQFTEAVAEFAAALRIRPDYPEAHNNLGMALLQVGRVPEAISHFEQAMQFKPDFAEAHDNLGLALLRTGQPREAIGHFEQAVRIRPEFIEARDNLGLALSQVGQMQEAIGNFEQALRIKPDFAEAHNNLGIALSQAGRSQEAIGHFEQAIRLKPDYAEAYYNLGTALAQLGQRQEALKHFEEAVRLKPNFTQAQASLARLQASMF